MRKWSEGFSKSSVVPGVFLVKDDFKQSVAHLLTECGVPHHWQGGLFCTSYRAFPVLDGYVIDSANEGSPFGRIPSGKRVIGANALRLLCYRLGVKQPRRFDYEKSVPHGEQLEIDFQIQLQSKSEALNEDDRGLLFPRNNADLTLLVVKLFGESHIPREVPWDVADQLSGPDDWGKAGLSMLDYLHLAKLQVTLQEAKEWRSFCKPHEASTLINAGVSIEVARKWNEVGCNGWVVPKLIQLGLKPGDVLPWAEAGGFPGNYGSAFEKGVTLEQARPYFEIGCSDLRAVEFVSSGVDFDEVREIAGILVSNPWDWNIVQSFVEEGLNASDAERWRATGVRDGVIGEAVSSSISIADVIEMAESGKSYGEIESSIRKLRRTKSQG